MSHCDWTGFSRSLIAAAAAAVVVAAPALAQNTTSAVSGVVSGPDGKPVGGATVTVVHVESGSTITTTTDASGRYNVRGLRAGGPYTITVSGAGTTVRRENVSLALAETLGLDLALSAVQTVTVTGTADRINRGTIGAGTNVGSRELATYASVARSLQDFARLDPRLSQTEKDRGEIAAAGQNSRYNSITIDGVRINDTFGLEPNNLPTIKQPISIDAIQAVQVNISNYDVTQQGYTGANINAVTKSGTNEFKGSVYYVYRDEQLAGDRFQLRPERYVPPPPFEDTTKGFTLGGPIIKDRLFFFASYEELSSSRNSPGFGPIGSGLSEVGITPQQVAAAQAAARAKGFDIGEFTISSANISVKDTLFKLDWNVTDNHRANVRYTKTEQTEPIFPGYSATTFSLSSRNFATAKTLETIVGQVYSDWTDNFATELKVSNRKVTSQPILNSRLPEIQFRFTSPAPPGTATGTRQMSVGTEETRHFNRIETDTTNAFLAGTWTLGGHEVKFGADHEKNDIFNAFVRRAWGQYQFEGPDPVALFIANNPTFYSVQLPRPGFTLLDAAAIVTFENLGVFVQDTWNVNKELSLQYGVRVDQIGVDKAPVHNPAAQAAFGLDNRNTFDGKQLVQPRFGFNYRLPALPVVRTSQLRGGAGLFQGAAAAVWLVNPYQTTGMVLNDFTCSTTTAIRCPPGLFSANVDSPASIAGVTPAANVDFLGPGASQPAVWKMNLAWDAELPFGFTVGAEWLHTRVKQGLTYRHLNLGTPTATAPDGRQMFWSAGGRNAACWDGAATPLTSGACAGTTNADLRPTTRFRQNRSFANVLVADKTTEGKGDAVTIQAQQNVRDWGLNWTVAYTRSSATEVSPLTSSTSNSQWANRSNYNPNEIVAARSQSLIRDRINVAANWSRAFFGTYRTTVGVFYEGRSGRPYSWTFNNDMNGDGVQGNDLLYIPRDVGSGEVLFRLPGQSVAASGAAAEAKFWEVVNGTSSLRNSRGGVVSRNSDLSKFTNNVDVRLSQEVPGFLRGHKGVVTFDILNFANLLNKKWGRIEEVTFNDNAGGFSRRWINYAGIQDGKMVYSVNDPFGYNIKNNKGESAWQMQITVRYEF